MKNIKKTFGENKKIFIILITLLIVIVLVVIIAVPLIVLREKKVKKPNLEEFEHQVECGTIPPMEQLRIIGGVDVAGIKYPWMVYMDIRRGENRFRCGGAIITPTVVLTAAHCLQTDDQINVLSGTNKMNVFTHFRKMTSMIIHEDYDKNTLKNDIALIVVNSPFSLEFDEIEPICVPTLAHSLNDELTVTGWGVADEETHPITLKETKLQVLSEGVCKENFRNPFHLSQQICAGDIENEKDACEGDSGGPLIDYDGEKAMIVGVVSYGGTPCQGVGVYTRTKYYIKWLNEQIRKIT
ncbi:hypothetical protein SNEBB_010313 [Seison nebaliae]|nr:hypothetical protein SNEBB_010313 [Seison nebaliae]